MKPKEVMDHKIYSQIWLHEKPFAAFLALGGAGFIKQNFQGVLVVCRAFHEFIAVLLSNLCVCHLCKATPSK
jgi:hypothetical protein